MSKAEKSRQYIIEKTAPLFNTKGVAGTAVTDIMQATQMAKGSLYVHFANKEELTFCAVDWNLQQFVNRVSQHADKFENPKAKFCAVLDYLGDPLNPPVQGGCPMMNFGMESDDTSPVIRNKVYDTICLVQQFMVDILAEGVSTGVFNADWDYKEFALKAYAMVEGGILIARVSQNNTQMQILINILKRELNDQTLKAQ